MASLKLRSRIGNKTQAEHISTISCDDLLKAIERKEKKQNQSFSNAADRTLHTIEACTKEIPHSREAAVSARNKIFALYDYFGCGTIFVTFSPSIGSTIRIQMFAKNTNIDLPTAHSCSDSQQTKADLEYHYNISSLFPGAGVLEFRHQYEIFISKLLKWDKKNCTSSGIGVYGKVEAFASAIEEQMNTLLHAHFNIFISGLGLLKKDLYSNDYQLQSNAKTEMKKYLSSIISTSFGKDLPTDHLKKIVLMRNVENQIFVK